MHYTYYAMQVTTIKHCFCWLELELSWLELEPLIARGRGHWNLAGGKIEDVQLVGSPVACEDPSMSGMRGGVCSVPSGTLPHIQVLVQSFFSADLKQ